MRLIIPSLLILTSLCASSPQYTVVEDRSDLTIDTPSLALRKVGKIRLANGLEALLISDPETPESGAALAVHCGSWDDPKKSPGTAHFVEHMLFLGTEKYPEEEGYFRYLDEHGGNKNAFTMNDRTVYMFSVQNEAFSGALDRFGQFFIAPLFQTSGIERERHAIHQEYCKNIPLDVWRTHYVQKALANPHHPYHDFNIGNLDTLKGITTSDLKAWYRTHYSADRMHLVVYSAKPLDVLQEEVASLFGAVKQTAVDRETYDEPLHLSRETPQLTISTPVQDIQMLELQWELPRFYTQDRVLHVQKLLGYILGHEGSSSLLSQLKKEHLAEKLAAGSARVGYDQSELSVVIYLTSKGVEEYQTVLERFFEALASVKQSGIPKYIYEEVKQLETLKYRYQSRGDVFDCVTEYATALVDEPLDTFPRQTLLPSSYDTTKISELLATLTPTSCQYTLVAPPTLTKITPTSKEKWLGAEYSQIPLPTDLVRHLESVEPHPAIAIPRPNPFIPKNLGVRPASLAAEQEILPEVKKLRESARGQIFCAQDNRFLVPKISWRFLFHTPKVDTQEPSSLFCADLFCHTVKERLNEKAYLAELAGLRYNLRPQEGGIELKVEGYQEKAGDFLQVITQELKKAIPSEDECTLYTDMLKREYNNRMSLSPLKQAGEILSRVLYKNYVGPQEKMGAMETVSYPEVVDFCHHLFTKCYVEGFLYGNEREGELMSVCKCVEKVGSLPYPPAQHQKKEIAALHSCAYLKEWGDHPANGLILTLDCGDFSFKRMAAQKILAKGLEEPFFSELRTKQQTAYVVSNWAEELERHLYLFFAIQSSSHEARDLLSRFELFLEQTVQNLATSVIPRERFEALRGALIHKWKNPQEDFSSVGDLLYKILVHYDRDYEWLAKSVAAAEDLTYEEFVELSRDFLGKSNTKRLGVAVQGAPKEQFVYREVGLQAIKDEISYRSR